jgi:hypothetical protein
MSDPGQQITVLTTTGMYKQLQEFQPHHRAINIQRMGRSGPGIGKVSRLLSYGSFYLGAVWQLLMKQPVTVLYYETISSFPAYFYKRFIAPRAKIMIHYHEYTSPAEYRQGMWLTKYFHKLERWLYPRAAWVSHTNTRRMNLFLGDIKPINVKRAEAVPNFPSRSWHQKNIAPPGLPLRFVYVGALSMETMYTKEMAEWILGQEGKATWDIYSYNITTEAREYLSNLDSPWIRLWDGKDYTGLPKTLCNYHIGVILYKGHIPNYVFNAPNKLFEYLNSGLKVWLPGQMTGAMEYVDAVNVRAIDFNDPGLPGMPVINIPGHGPATKGYYAEEVFVALKDQLLNNTKD